MSSLSLLFVVIPLVVAEPLVYMFPTNPELHPSSIYPNQQFMRGKVRDLPDDGVIYLNRIKPIGQQFAVPIAVKKADSSLKILKKSEIPSSFEKYSSVEERAPKKNIAPPLPKISTTGGASDYIANIRPNKIAEPKKSVQKTKIPEEIELDNLLDDLLRSEGKSKKLAGLPKIAKSSAKRHVGDRKPKLIAFDGTARILPTTRAQKSAVSVRLTPQKLYTGKQRDGADFDPWERMGQ